MITTIFDVKLYNKIQALSKTNIHSGIAVKLIYPEVKRRLDEVITESGLQKSEVFFVLNRKEYGYGENRSFVNETNPDKFPPLCETFAKMITLFPDYNFVVSHPILPYVEYFLGLPQTYPYKLIDGNEFVGRINWNTRKQDCLSSPELFTSTIGEINGRYHDVVFYPYPKPEYEQETKNIGWIQYPEFYELLIKAVRDFDLLKVSPERAEEVLVKKLQAPVGFTKECLRVNQVNLNIVKTYSPSWWIMDNVLFLTCDVWDLME